MVENDFRRTKIVATIGPASSAREQLLGLMEAGTDVFRLNFSHGDHPHLSEVVKNIRDLSRNRKRAVAILGDLQGPKIRTGRMRDGALALVTGQQVTITTDKVLGDGDLIPTDYAALPDDVRPGDQILLDDGLLELEVVEIDKPQVHCRVVVGGLLKDRKGINLPGVPVSAPALTAKDRGGLAFCIDHELDYVALSFVRSANEVEDLKNYIYHRGSALRVIAKIEKPQAVADFEAILDAADGIMVARGDLGVEINPEKVPLIQKENFRY